MGGDMDRGGIESREKEDERIRDRERMREEEKETGWKEKE